MRLTTLLFSTCLSVCLALGGIAACDKDDDGDGGGGGWIVTDDGVSIYVPDYGDAIGDYDVAVRGDAVWVVADHGLVLRSFDRGASWQALELDTTRDLHTVIAEDDGSVYVAGDGLQMLSEDDGDSWSVVEVAPF